MPQPECSSRREEEPSRLGDFHDRQQAGEGVLWPAVGARANHARRTLDTSWEAVAHRCERADDILRASCAHTGGNKGPAWSLLVVYRSRTTGVGDHRESVHLTMG